MLYRNLTGPREPRVLQRARRPTRLHARAARSSSSAQSACQPDAADQRVGTYSKGMRQKVGIAIALAKNAKALLLDEPTSGLDPKAANEFSRAPRPTERATASRC